MVLVWRKDETELLYQGDFAVKDFPNIQKTSDGLEVNITSQKDLGNYACQMMISSEDSPKLTHTIVLPSPPVINSIRTLNNRTVVSENDI